MASFAVTFSSVPYTLAWQEMDCYFSGSIQNQIGTFSGYCFCTINIPRKCLIKDSNSLGLAFRFTLMHSFSSIFEHHIIISRVPEDKLLRFFTSFGCMWTCCCSQILKVRTSWSYGPFPVIIICQPAS